MAKNRWIAIITALLLPCSGSFAAAPAEQASPAAAGADSCVTARTGSGGIAESALTCCAKHALVIDAIDELYLQSEEEENEDVLIRRETELWTQALNAEYDALRAAASGDEREIVERDRDAYFAQLNDLRIAVSAGHPECSALADEIVIRQLMRQTAALCEMIHTAPERPAFCPEQHSDPVPDAEPAPFLCLIHSDETEHGILRRITMCDRHRAVASAVSPMAPGNASLQPWADARRLWLSVLDTAANDQTADDLPIAAVAQACLSFERWIGRREALLHLLYPGSPELADEIIAQTVCDRTVLLCAEGMIPHAGAPDGTAGASSLRRGDSGETVRILQRRLKTLGWYSGQAPGFYDPMTATAVKRFQQAAGLEITGIADETTQRALFRESAPGA